MSSVCDLDVSEAFYYGKAPRSPISGGDLSIGQLSGGGKSWYVIEIEAGQSKEFYKNSLVDYGTGISNYLLRKIPELNADRFFNYCFIENIYELIANSIDARRPVGKIKIGVTGQYNQKRQEFTLYFKDNGTGFNKLERGLFVPYKTEKFLPTKGSFYDSFVGNYLGGGGSALNGINNSLKDHKGKLSLANRRSGGAVLRLKWVFKNLREMETSSSDSESS